jgi:hypothetical protein
MNDQSDLFDEDDDVITKTSIRDVYKFTTKLGNNNFNGVVYKAKLWQGNQNEVAIKAIRKSKLKDIDTFKN